MQHVLFKLFPTYLKWISCQLLSQAWLSAPEKVLTVTSMLTLSYDVLCNTEPSCFKLAETLKRLNQRRLNSGICSEERERWCFCPPCFCSLDDWLLSLGSVVAQRSDHGSSAPPMLQAASAAGAPLVASPYPQSYLQYNPQQYGQQQVIQAMTPYPGQVARLPSKHIL